MFKKSSSKSSKIVLYRTIDLTLNFKKINLKINKSFKNKQRNSKSTKTIYCLCSSKAKVLKNGS